MWDRCVFCHVKIVGLMWNFLWAPFYILFVVVLRIFFPDIFSYFFGRFATSGYILPLSVPEISPGDGFCDGRRGRGIGYSRS